MNQLLLVIGLSLLVVGTMMWALPRDIKLAPSRDLSWRMKKLDKAWLELQATMLELKSAMGFVQPAIDEFKTALSSFKPKDDNERR